MKSISERLIDFRINLPKHLINKAISNPYSGFAPLVFSRRLEKVNKTIDSRYQFFWLVTNY